MLIWSLIKLCAKYTNPFYVFIFYHHNLLVQCLWHLLISISDICWHSNRYICWHIICHICWCTVRDVYNFITYNYWIINNTFKYLLLSQIHVLGFQLQSFLHAWYFLQSHWHLSLFHFWFELHVSLSNFHLQLDERDFTNTFASIIFVIILNKSTFTYFVLLCCC